MTNAELFRHIHSSSEITKEQADRYVALIHTVTRDHPVCPKDETVMRQELIDPPGHNHPNGFYRFICEHCGWQVTE